MNVKAVHVRSLTGKGVQVDDRIELKVNLVMTGKVVRRDMFHGDRINKPILTFV